ncbi:redoxin domain-containing protein [Actinomadura sp. 7K507]|uniref:TlpA family protein disulfide reductase n=1 Tax=Actinomadura sp. 7K507 TaxID=2530365 RepID=UPI0010444CC9|nr:redoxin domain-containing protein [Actinomadura sp. 7K507]TDC80971.1 redoxin domain-containing protein [Actinomadura sp. 7K507]
MKTRIATLVGAALLVGGCGGGATDAVEPATASPESTASQGSGGAGGDVHEALKFEGETLDGKAFDGASLAGKPVVFWFWAPWCPKCLSEGPDVAKAAGKYGDRVSFVGVGGLEKGKARLREFVSRTGTEGLTHLDDRTGKLYSHFKVTSQSSFVFMAPDGTMSKDSGPLGESELNRHVDELLG